MVAEANAKLEIVVQGIDPVNTDELVAYVNFLLSKVTEIALGKAQEVAVKWTEEYFSTSPILPLLRTLSKEGRVDVKVIDYQITLEAGLSGDLVATVEKLVMETLNRLLIREGRTNTLVVPSKDYGLQKERKPADYVQKEKEGDDESKEYSIDVIGEDGREGDPAKGVADDPDKGQVRNDQNADDLGSTSSTVSFLDRNADYPAAEASNGNQNADGQDFPTSTASILDQNADDQEDNTAASLNTGYLSLDEEMKTGKYDGTPDEKQNTYDAYELFDAVEATEKVPLDRNADDWDANKYEEAIEPSQDQNADDLDPNADEDGRERDIVEGVVDPDREQVRMLFASSIFQNFLEM